MAIINHIKNYLKVKLDLGVYSDEGFQLRIFTPFLKKKTYDGTGAEFYDEDFKEYSQIELTVEPNSSNIEIPLTAVSNVRSLTIMIYMDDQSLSVQPDMELFFNANTEQKHYVRGMLHMNFSTGPTKIIINNPSIYKKIFKIVYCGG